ncbi:ABC transporter ATP-binding protein [Pseudodesulfovibrio sp. S3]|uniref:ABC transporter ATP-binding protein n=1 Tax=unclassified Pseudodesulfovibrio TaxID=2661612 RepID=UPI0019D49ECA|nr:ABC transporter ATP-binding protein [Pseudodesulfovibrio sp. S3]MCJ2165250.1 ABC transporter ATP-binding protein [Pseudodesulfovibrio sp. S3-i]
MIDLKNIHKSYRLGSMDVEILKGVDMRVDQGEMLAVLGSSGCGKSTLMNILGFLDQPTSGEYFFEGRCADGLADNELSRIRNSRIGFVFQQFNLLPKLTALDNVCLPLLYRGIRMKDRVERGREMLSKVGMSDREDHRPGELSGGQQQRVAIARALCGSPSLILADEPTGALDTVTSSEIMELFLSLNADEGITVIIITHDPGLARLCGRSVLMQDGLVEPR